MTPPEADPVLVLACGALARELADLVRLDGLTHLEVECLPADLHNRPERIPAAVEARLDTIEAQGRRYRQVILGYADCGTGGRLDEVCRRRGVTRLPGAHCYEVLAGAEVFAGLHDREPGTFYLTDYLARHFDRLVIQGLGIDRHPELTPLYFGNYRRLVHLAQRDDPELARLGRAAASRLGLVHEHLATGRVPLRGTLVALTDRKVPAKVMSP